MIQFNNKVEVAVTHSCELGEGPVWDSINKQILWVDILKGEIHQYTPFCRKHTITKVGKMVSAIALCSSGGIIAAMENGFAKVDLFSKSVTYIKEVEKELIDNRFNDGKCDPAGRFWAGTMDVNGKASAGNLYALETDFTVNKKVEEVSCSNGLAWSPENNIFYYIDTPTSQVVAYDYEMKSGMLSNKRVVISIPPEEGLPDGMTVDSEGMLWIALWDGWKVARYNPVTGRRLCSISLPVARVTSCTFGGSMMEDIYITTAKTGLTSEDLKQQPQAGSIFVLKNSGFRGLQTFNFAG